MGNQLFKQFCPCLPCIQDADAPVNNSNKNSNQRTQPAEKYAMSMKEGVHKDGFGNVVDKG
jgi:hypothetical protein